MKTLRCFLLTLLFVGIWCAPLRSEAEQSEQQAAHKRNYNNCLHGYSGCDPSQLTDTERMEVQEAAHRRNYNNCLHGYSECDPSQLTDGERVEAQEAAHRRNYNNCLHGYSGCDLSQLTSSETEAVSEARRESPTGKATPSQTAPPRYYTNKDGQRVQSPTYSDTIPAGATAQVVSCISLGKAHALLAAFI